MVRSFVFGLKKFLNNPSQVFGVCVIFVVGGLLLKGNFLRLWYLYRDEDRIISEITLTKQDLHKIERQIQQARSPKFIEQQAKERLDMVADEELMFVFSE